MCSDSRVPTQREVGGDVYLVAAVNKGVNVNVPPFITTGSEWHAVTSPQFARELWVMRHMERDLASGGKSSSSLSGKRHIRTEKNSRADLFGLEIDGAAGLRVSSSAVEHEEGHSEKSRWLRGERSHVPWWITAGEVVSAAGSLTSAGAATAPKGRISPPLLFTPCFWRVSPLIAGASNWLQLANLPVTKAHLHIL